MMKHWKKASLGIALGCVVVTALLGCGDLSSNNNTNEQNIGGGDIELPPPPATDSYETIDKLDFDTAKSGNKALPFLTKEAIKKMIQDTDSSKFPADGNKGEALMLEKPCYTAPYSVGKPKPEAITYALARLNNLRRIAGLPTVEIDETLNDKAQHNAFLNAYYNTGDGDDKYNIGTKPEDMDQTMYNKGKDTTTANRFNRPRLIDSSDYYLVDQNVTNLGHRFPILQIDLKKVGFGVASAHEGFGFTATQFYPGLAQSQSTWPGMNPVSFDWDFVTWPAPGYFPLNTGYGLFQANTNWAYWSIYFNPKTYKLATHPRTVFTVENSRGQKWSTDETKKEEGYEFFTYTLSNAVSAAQSCVFQLPDAEYKDGDRYTVTISNLAGSKSFSYTVDFFDVKK